MSLSCCRLVCRPFRRTGVLGLFALAAVSVLAQTVPLPSSTAATAKETDAIVLSPFTVSAEQDNGYQAANTLAGSRLNTKLSETPATIFVFTEEFLKDLGATGLAQVLEYGVNTNADYGNVVTTSPSFFYMDGGLVNDVRVNNRGLFASKTIDFLDTMLPTDTYNTGRFDVSSGPNSVLFGFGSAGGIVNASTREVEFNRTQLRTTLTTGSWNALRSEADLNVALAKGKAGLRLMGVHDETDTWRRYAGRNNDRWTAVLGVRPFKGTTLTALYEKGDLQNVTERPYNRLDSLSYWWQQGRATVDNTSFGTSTSAVQNAYGIRGVGSRNIFVANDGRAAFSRAGSANTVVYESASRYESGVSSGIPTQRQESGSYQTLLPFAPQANGMPYAPLNINYYGDDRIRTSNLSRKFLRLQQKIGKNGFVELAYNYERASGFSHQLSGDFVLYGDPNQYLPNPDGTATRIANAHAGQLYVEQIPYFNTEINRNEVVRATVSWNLDLGRFGEHRLAGMADRTENKNRYWQGPEILVNRATQKPINNEATPENSVNMLYLRNYVTAGAPETYIPARRDPSRVISYGGTDYVGRLVTNGNLGGSSREIESLMVATQSRFWKGRLIVTGGLRHDVVDLAANSTARLLATDPLVLSGEKVAGEFTLLGDNPTASRSYRFDTYTAGAVFVVAPWLRGFYNESNNNGAPAASRRVLPDASFAPAPEGVGRDWGLMMSFLDGRIFARATAYHTMARNDATVGDSVPINAHRRIVAAIRDAGLISQAEADTRALSDYAGAFTSDLDTKGYELEVKASLTKDWTLTAAYSYTDLMRSNLGQEWNPWFADQKAFYSRYPSTLLTTANVPISTEIYRIENAVENTFAANRLGYNNRPNKANAFTRYSFSGGRLKGLFVGGGVRWQQRNVIQRELVGFDELGKDILGKKIYGPEIFNMDALIGYSTRLKWSPLGQATTLRAQLNISNFLDSERIQIIRMNRVGDGYWRIVAREPRAFRVSVTLGF